MGERRVRRGGPRRRAPAQRLVVLPYRLTQSPLLSFPQSHNGHELTAAYRFFVTCRYRWGVRSAHPASGRLQQVSVMLSHQTLPNSIWRILPPRKVWAIPGLPSTRSGVYDRLQR